MDISSGLIAKGAAGALAASAATAAGVIYKDQIFGKSLDLTKFDNGLIEFLKNGGDIVFDVKKGTGDDDFTATDLDLSGSGPLSLTAKINISVDKNSKEKLIEKNDNDKKEGKVETLQKLNEKEDNTEGVPWIWTCEVIFTSKEKNLTGKSIHNRDKIFSSAGEVGLFNLLKKKISTGDTNTKKNIKNAKERFIRTCAKKRENNWDIEDKKTLEGNKLESSITINLKAGEANDKNGQTDTNTLYPKKEPDKKLFEKLFEGTSAEVISPDSQKR